MFLINTIENNSTLVIDEMDRSLHPILMNILIQYFNQKKSINKGQIIASTHDPLLMDTKVLRQDSLWFITKDKAGASNIKSLEEYELNNCEKAFEPYLERKFDGILKKDEVIEKLLSL